MKHSEPDDLKAREDTEEIQIQPDDLAHLSDQDEYVSLFLRMWQENDDQGSDNEVSWRSEVEHIQSGGSWAFSTLGELEQFLCDFLRQQGENVRTLQRSRNDFLLD